ncbi:MAG: hypothetical protein KF729_35015, partial [Sandaracinaceae bacterium]|nr:hypothetical protein [Sandaracinaceae bacterium]
MNSSPATELPTARGLVDAPPIPMAGPPSSGVVFPVVLVISLLAHGAVFAAAVAVPHTRFEIAPAPVELAFEVVAPAPAAPEPAPLPEPVPEVAPEVA